MGLAPGPVDLSEVHATRLQWRCGMPQLLHLCLRRGAGKQISGEGWFYSSNFTNTRPPAATADG